MKVNNDIFSDDFYMMGIDADDFRKAIRKVSDETACCKVNSANFRIISVIDSDRDGFLMMRLNPTALTMKSMIYSESYKEDYYFADKNENYGFLSYDLMRRNGITDAMIDEIRRCGFFLLYAMGDREMIIIPSESSLNDLYKEFDISKIDSSINPLRNLYLSSLMARCKDFQILLRRKEDIYRLCGTASQKHMYLSLEDTAGMLLDGLMKNHSDAQVMSWHVSQRETAVNLSFNDRTFMVGGTEVRPGAQILASDFGQTAMAIRNILYVNEAPLILSFKSSLRNIGSALPETVLSSYEADGYHLLDNVQKRIEDVIGKMKPEAAEEEYMKQLDRKYGFISELGNKNYAKYLAEYPYETGTVTAEKAVERLLNMTGFTQDIVKPYAVEKLSAAVGRIAGENGKGVKH